MVHNCATRRTFLQDFYRLQMKQLRLFVRFVFLLGLTSNLIEKELKTMVQLQGQGQSVIETFNTAEHEKSQWRKRYSTLARGRIDKTIQGRGGFLLQTVDV